MVTIEEYFETLAEPWRTQALNNRKQFLSTKSKYRGIKVNDVAGAVMNGFSWEQTPEKFPYWAEIYESLRHHEKAKRYLKQASEPFISW